MTLVTGSTEGAAESLDYIKKISGTLGLEVSSTANNFVSLSAAAKGTALEGQGTRDIFEAVSKAMALLGKSSADTGGALTAIQQIISKGTVSSEELRGQLGERLPGAFQIAARAIGVTTQELGKLLEEGKIVATDFLPKFAAELNKTFGDTSEVNTFNAELNRTINALKDLAVVGGDAGIFGDLTESLRGVTGFIKATSLEIQILTGVFNATKNFLASGGKDWDEYKAALNRVKTEASIAQNEFFKTNESLAETSRLARLGSKDLIDWSQQVNESAAESKRLGLEGEDATAKLAASYKLLGLSVKTAGDAAILAFGQVTRAAGSTGDEVTKALKIVLPKIDNVGELERVVASLEEAAKGGKITWEKYGVEVKNAGEAFLKNTGYVKGNTDELKKQADAAEKAKEKAIQLALELEKISSNERIKFAEFQVKLDVAKIEADTKRIEAAFSSINDVIGSTNDLIGNLFGILANPNLDWAQIRAMRTRSRKKTTSRKAS